MLVFHPSQATLKCVLLHLAVLSPSLSFSTLDSRPLSSTCFLFDLQTRARPFTQSPDRSHLLSHVLSKSVFLPVSVSVSFSRSLVFFSPLPVIIPFLCLLWDLCIISSPLVGRCQAARRGLPLLGVGMLGGVLIAVTA